MSVTRQDERDDSRHDSEGGASPTLRPEHAGIWRSPGRAGFDIVPAMPFRQPPRSAQCLTGQPSRYTLPVRLSTRRGRPPACHRRGRSPPSHLLATAPMVRRWAARGKSRGGPEGRRSRTPRGSSPACDDVPLSLGHATPPATCLMGRRDARPHNTDQKAGALGRHATDVPEETGSITSGLPMLPRRKSTSTFGSSASRIHTSRKRNHRLESLRRRPRNDLASSQPKTLMRRIVGASIPTCP